MPHISGKSVKTKLIIFGITGDLGQRKLIPALRNIVKTVDDLQIIGVSRRNISVEELMDDLASRTSMFTMDLANAESYADLWRYVDLQPDEQALVYLSVPPSASADIVDFLGQSGFSQPNVMLLFEKPFGFDLASAQDYISRTARYFDDSQLYRIDHYAAKDITQRIIDIDSKENWSNGSVESIDIIASESIGVEGRAVFYEQTGALRDLLQGHLLQLLAVVLMKNDGDIPQSRLDALNKITPADPLNSIRGQYEGYDVEVGNIGSTTETFARVCLYSKDERWQDVPMTLTTGKNLDKKRLQVKIHFKDGAEEIFDEMVGSGEAYEKVLLEAIYGNKTIFTTGPEVIRAWEILAPVQESWAMDNVRLRKYKPGSTIESIV